MLGAAAAPEDQTMTGALTGAGMGYAAGALGSHLHQRLTGPKPAGGKPAAPAVAAPHPGYEPEHMAEVERHLSGQNIRDQISTAAKPKPIHDAAMSPERAARVAKMVAPAAARPVTLPTHMRPPAGGFHFKGGACGFRKLAEHSVAVSPQGASLGLSSKDERLEGMNRWVPRSTLERAFEGSAAGFDDQALVEEAVASGNLKHPAVGAVLGAALAHLATRGHAGTLARYGVSPSLAPKILGGLVGAGAGSTYNNATAGQRGVEMHEALKGVHHERRRAQPTAQEATPLVVSAAGGDT
jgi:hypothetical protein